MKLSKKMYMLMSADNGGDNGAGGDGGEGSKDGAGTEQFAKLKTEKENYKKAAADAKAEAETLRAQLKTKEEGELKAKEDYKALAELKDTQAKEWESKFNALNGQVQEKDNLIKTSQKKGAIRKELIANGLDEKAVDTTMKLIDLDSVKFDEDANAFYGVETAVKSVREQLPALFGNPVNIPGGNAPGGKPAGKLTLETWKALPLEERKKRQHEV